MSTLRINAIEKFESEGIDGDPRQQVETFSTAAFEERLRLMVAREYDSFTAAIDTQL